MKLEISQQFVPIFLGTGLFLKIAFPLFPSLLFSHLDVCTVPTLIRPQKSIVLLLR